MVFSLKFKAKNVLLCLLGFYFVSIFCISYLGLFKGQIEPWANNLLESSFGNQPLSQENEAEVRAIIDELNYKEPVIIKKMNWVALQKFGYYNAFACYNMEGGFISGSPHIFASDNFFKDLSPEERRFIIGHEVMHLRERHIHFINFVMLFVSVLLLIFYIVFLYPFLNIRFKALSIKHANFLKWGSFLMIVIACSFVVSAISNASRRYIEADADCKSVTELGTHAGGLKIIDRWCKDFKMPEHNSYYGIFADHPSCFQRREYITNLSK